MKSLFNAESGCNFDLDADIDTTGEWSIGVVVGPSGSGKTSIGRQIFGDPAPFLGATLAVGCAHHRRHCARRRLQRGDWCAELGRPR